jgi:hypothetical protein
MQDALSKIQHLLQEVATHLNSPAKSDRTAAVTKLHRIASISETLAFTVAAKR